MNNIILIWGVSEDSTEGDSKPRMSSGGDLPALSSDAVVGIVVGSVVIFIIIVVIVATVCFFWALNRWTR